jgi:hypothetical protein
MEDSTAGPSRYSPPPDPVAVFPAIVEAAISVRDPVAAIPPPSVAVLPVTDTLSTERAPSLCIAPPVPTAAFPMKSE